MENQASAAVPHAREAQIFPRLDWETIGRLLPYGTVEAPPAGEILFRQGDRAVDFFVVLEGAVDLLNESVFGSPTVFRSYDVGQFTGELHLFNDRALLVTGRTAEGTRVLRIARQSG